ncbi:hypothetical protein PIB30_049285 [Stylosanthes scabra]|uniref:Uncharacterized protein n=1 Tax=Stylosanthes scabra TaxID=79078 RepID=A0ABU6YEQ4_9FABA|nr:hypothetical protein [Stylosanthes scabra]
MPPHGFPHEQYAYPQMPQPGTHVAQEDSAIQRLLDIENWSNYWAESQPGAEQVQSVQPTRGQPTPIQAASAPVLSRRMSVDCRPQPRRITTHQSGGRRSVDSMCSGCEPMGSVFTIRARQDRILHVTGSQRMTFDLNESALTAEEEEGESNDIDDDLVMGLANMGASGLVAVGPYNLRENVGPPDKFSPSPFQRLTKGGKQLAKGGKQLAKEGTEFLKESVGLGKKKSRIIV